MAVKWTRRNVLKAGIAAGAAAGAASIPFLPFKYSSAGRNVIFILVDCLRADSVGKVRLIDGVLKSLTPNIDALAAGGMRFTNARAPSTFTPISMLALMYDMPPMSVSYTGRSTRVPPPQRSIAARVRDAGYLALLACSNDIMQMHSVRTDFDRCVFPSMNENRRGLAAESRRGGLWPERYGTNLNKHVSRLLDRSRWSVASKPLFLQVHYMDCHEPYNATGFTTSLPMDDQIYPQAVSEWVSRKRVQCPGKQMTVEQSIAYLSERFDSAVHAVDKSVGELLALLRERRILDDALVVVTADHGEEFADNTEIERKHVGHGGPMDEQLIRVPFIVNAAGRMQYGAPGMAVAGHVLTTRIFNDIVTDYAAVAPGQYSLTRAALDAAAYPEHAVVSSLRWVQRKTNESACTLRRKEGLVKYRVFYRDDGSVRDERLYAYGPDGQVGRVEMSDDVKEAAAAVLKERPKAPTLNKESEEKLKALGYIDGQ